MSTDAFPAEFPSRAVPRSKQIAKLALWPLVAATFFMVSGGTYGTEDIIHGAGYGRGILILLLTPLIWSLPTALMVGELSSTVPAEGGYYAWVRRAMGNFWGFQEAWISLMASVFDMAIYPTLFLAYLERLVPWFSVGHRGLMMMLAVVAVCALLNIAGIHVVGISSLWLFFLLSAPFAVIVLLAPFRIGAFSGATVHATSTVGLVGGVLICMWNYMGWDNASTIATEVRHPQRTYPRAIFLSVVVVTISYVLPVVAMWLTGISSGSFETGSWADFAGMMAGPWLRVALVLGGMMSGFGMFNALVMSYSRLPLAMAQDGMLPRVFMKVHPKTRAPWVAILVLATGWALCLGLGFERLVTIDILLDSTGVLLEFVALVVLRVKEPELRRPFRVPGGIIGAISCGVCPTVLIGFSIAHSQTERVWGMNGLTFSLLLMAGGLVVWAVKSAAKRDGWLASAIRQRDAA